MTPATIDVSFLGRPPLVTGCTLPISVTLTNVAPLKELLLVQSPDAATPFEYELVSARGSFRLSKRLYDQAALEHGLPPLRPQLKPLVAGASCTYTDDVARWLTTPIPAGTYELLVHWDAPSGERLTAPALSITLGPLLATHHVCNGDVGGQVLLSVFGHGAEPAAVYRRISTYARPALGFGVPLAQARPLSGVALACELDDVSQWRWFAWLSGDHLCGAIHWGSEVVKTLDPTPVGVTNAKLLSLGWQTRHAAAVFLALGELGGQAAVDVILIPQVGEPQHCVYPLQCPVPDAAVAGSYFPGLGVLELILGFDRSGRTQLLAQHLDISLTDSPLPRALLEVQGSLRALSIAPRVHDASTIDAVVGDAVVGDALYRIELGTGTTEQFPLRPLANARAWSLPAVPHSSCPVLVQVGDSLTVARAKESPEFRSIASSLHGVSHGALAHLAPTDGSGDGRLVCAYVDGELGYTVVGLTALESDQEPEPAEDDDADADDDGPSESDAGPEAE